MSQNLLLYEALIRFTFILIAYLVRAAELLFSICANSEKE